MRDMLGREGTPQALDKQDDELGMTMSNNLNITNEDEFYPIRPKSGVFRT